MFRTLKTENNVAIGWFLQCSPLQILHPIHPQETGLCGLQQAPVGSANLRHQVSLQGSHLLPAAPCCPPRLSASFSQQPALVIGPTHTALSPGSGFIFFPCSFQPRRAKAPQQILTLRSCIYPLWPSLSPTPFVNCSFIQFSWILFKSATQFECAITFLGKTFTQSPL